MPKLTAESFVSVVRQSGLVAKDQLKRVVEDIQRSGLNISDSDVIADCLVKQQLLTEWQAEKLKQGRHKGFSLGKYRLLKLLGKGGMSSVYLAEHVLMRRRCAVKVLPIKRVKDSSYLARFHREAQAVAALDHPNIVRAYDIDHEMDKDTEIHFLVMEFVEGKSIHDLVKENGPFSVEQTAEYVRQAALGLGHAHKAGLVHRDVKPGNLLVDPSGTVKLLDLGLARFAERPDESSLTVANDEKVLGTADYLSPEQALDSHLVDQRADIYSLGCTIYYCLTGHPPFREGTIAQRLMWHQAKEPPPISNDRPDVPESFLAIVRKMMAKKPEDRYSSMADVVDVLKKWLDRNASPEWAQTHQNPGSAGVAPKESERPADALNESQTEPAARSSASNSAETVIMAPAETATLAAETTFVPSEPTEAPAPDSDLASFFEQLRSQSDAAVTTPAVQTPKKDVPASVATATVPPKSNTVVVPAAVEVPAQSTVAPQAKPTPLVAVATQPASSTGSSSAVPVAAEDADTAAPMPWEIDQPEDDGGAFSSDAEVLPALEPQLLNTTAPTETPTISATPIAMAATVTVARAVAATDALPPMNRREPQPVAARVVASPSLPTATAVPSPIQAVPVGKPFATAVATPVAKPIASAQAIAVAVPVGAGASADDTPFPWTADTNSDLPIASAVAVSDSTEVAVVAQATPVSAGTPVAQPVAGAPNATPVVHSPKKPIPLKMFALTGGGILIACIAAAVYFAVSSGSSPAKPGAAAPTTTKNQNAKGSAAAKKKPAAKTTAASTAGGPQREPPPKPAPAPAKPIDGRIIEVGPNGHFHEIWEALSHVRSNRSKFGGTTAARQRANVTIEVAGGHSYQAIAIDNTDGEYPVGIHIIAQGERAKLKPREDGLAVRLLGVEYFRLENFDIDVAGRETAIELFGYCTKATLANLSVSGFTKTGLLGLGPVGRNREMVTLQGIDFRPAADTAVAMRFTKSLTFTRYLVIEGCRTFGPQRAGIEFTGPATQVECRENIIDQAEVGLRFAVAADWKNMLIANNTFYGCRRAGIAFSEMPTVASGNLAFQRNLFAKCSGPELLIEKDFDQTRFDAVFIKQGGNGIEQNWTDRKEPANPSNGERELVLDPKQRVPALSFVSTDPASPDFLAIPPTAPYANVANPQFETQPFIGAKPPKK